MNDQGYPREPATTEEIEYLHQRVAELEKIAARYKQAEAVEKQQRQLLQRRSAELATMLEVTRAISSSLDLEEILLQVAKHAAGLASADGCTLSKWDRESNTIVTWLEWRRDDRPCDPPGTVYALANFPASRRALESGQHFILRIDDKHADPVELAFLQQAGLISVLFLPLIARQHVIGLLELNYSGRQPDVNPDDIALYSALADQAAVAIDKAHLYSENERRLREQTALREAGLVISSTLDQEDVLHHIVQQMGQVLDATSAYLCNYNPETETVAMLAQYIGPQASQAEQGTSYGTANAASSGLPAPLNFCTGQTGPEDLFRVQHRDDPELDAALRRRMEQSGAKTVLVVPLRIGGRVVAYAELWESRQRRQFSVEEITLVQGLAQQAAIAIENARLYRQAQQEINERKLTEAAERRQRKALQESEERFRRAFEDAGIGMALVGLSGKFLEVNSALCDMLGYSEAELKAIRFQSIIHPDDLDISLTGRAQLLASQVQRFQAEKRYLHKSGSLVWMQVTISLVRDDQGYPLYQVVQYLDITASKRMAEALAAERNLLRTLIDTVPDYVYVKDLQSRFVLYNRAVFTPHYSGPSDELRGKTDFDIHSPELAAEFYSDDQRVIGLGQALVNKEERVVRLDGEQKWLLTTKVPLHNSSGQVIGIVGVGRDITDRKRAMEALRESETRYRTLFENSPVALWEVDAAEVKRYLDQLRQAGVTDLEEHIAQHPEVVSRCMELCQLVDANRAALRISGVSDRTKLLANLSPPYTSDLVEIYKSQLQQVASGQTQVSCESLTYVFNGIERCLNLHWTVAPGYEETYGKVLISLVDMTARIQAEQALQRYAGRLAALHDIDRSILTVQSPEEVARAALSHIQQMIPFCRASVVAFDLKTGSATVLAARLKSEIKWDEGLAVSTADFETGVLEQGQVYQVDDTRAGAQVRPLDQTLLEEGVRSFVNVPLRAGGELIGSLNLGSDQPHAFDAEHLDIAREVASSLALAIHQARLYQQTRQDAATKAALLNEVNHRVKNNLGAIAGILHVERRRAELTGQSQCGAIITDLITRVQGLAAAHSLLSASEWGDLLLTNLARQVINSALQMAPAGKHIYVQLSSSPLLVSPKQANTLALVLNELATNTIKHALGARETGRLMVHIFQENTSICIEFRDDGPGYPAHVLDHEEYNTGLYLVNSLIRQDLAGQINFANNRGAVATIRFKISNQPAKER